LAFSASVAAFCPTSVTKLKILQNPFLASLIPSLKKS